MRKLKSNRKLKKNNTLYLYFINILVTTRIYNKPAQIYGTFRVSNVFIDKSSDKQFSLNFTIGR